MPTDDPLIGYEDPSDPGFKIARGNAGLPGGRPGGAVSPPPGVAGGGYGSFFGSPTAGTTTFSSAPKKRDIYAKAAGFKPWMALPDDPSLPVADTVPAMMRPGEGVLTPEAMSGLGITPEILALLNQIGAVQHFATGGVVQPLRGFRRPMPGGVASPAPAAATANTVGSLPATGATTTGVSGSGSGTGSQWAPSGWNPSGDPTLQLTPLTGTGGDQSRLLNYLYQVLSGGASGGAFNPNGSPAVMAAVKENALGNADAARARAGTLAQLSGADPASRANYMLQTDLAGQGGAAKASNDAVLAQLLGSQDWMRNLFGSAVGANFGDWNAERQGDISKRYAPDQPSAWNQLLGMGAQAAGAYLGAR